MTFSEKLSAAMHEKKVSIRELSEKTGIPKSAIQRYTSGETDKIPIDRMKLMAEALGIDPAYVMGWVDVSDRLHATLDPILGPDTPAAKKLREIGEALATDEHELVSIYRELNSTGQQALLGTARGLASNPDMKKDGASNDATA